jgi:hypothetical protein
MRDLRRAATDGPRFRRGTVRTPESVPGCSIEVPEVSASTFAGTVRAERTRPAESAANGFASGIECGAIPPRFQRGDQLMNRSPDRDDVVGAPVFPRRVADVRVVGDHDRDLRCA